jgi:Fe-S-cluster containining protein
MTTSLTVIDLPVINLSEARFECIFGRGCEGTCCRNGRPPVYPDEQERIEENLHKFLPHLRPEARQVLQKSGYLSNRKKIGLPMLRVVDGWCVFFNEGCVLHKVGAAEGDKYQYKPAPCALFPLARNDKDEWYVRQKGVEGEEWDLPCLGPTPEAPPAAESLREEIELAARYGAEGQADEVNAQAS